MSRVLSQDEIQALLSAVPAPLVDAVAAATVVYDFRRPDRVSKEQLRSLHLLHDRFARNVTSSLSAYLRTSVEVSMAAVEQYSYSEFLLALPDPTAFYSLKIRNFDSLGALELNPTVAFTVVDRMLGGSGRGRAPDRALTEIEQTVVDSVVRLILEHLSETWRAVMDVQFTIDGRETRPQMLPIAGRNEIMIVMGFDMKLGEVRSLLHICIPTIVVESVGLSFSHGWQQTVPDPTAHQQAQLVESLGRVAMPVAALLDTRLRAREVLGLSAGDVLNLGVPVAAPVRICVGDRIKYTGRLTARDARAAVLIERAHVPGTTESGGAHGHGTDA
jgi:flagellar motor switch protein FliM